MSDEVAVIRVDVGERVYCDDCSREYTASDETGGVLFQSKAIGPCCAAKWLDRARRYDETRFVRRICPPGVAFAEWVRGLR